MAELGEFLERAAKKPVVCGSHDCMLFPTDWLLEITGLDAAAPWRGHYKTERGARLILSREGGMIALMGKGAERVGARALAPAHAPPGSVGVVLAPTSDGAQHMGAIRTPCGWAVLSDAGVTVHPLPALAAWAVI